MSRYRPPSPPKSKYITAQGYQNLLAELNYLWREKRPLVTQSVSEAAAQGDRSENAEYIYGKKQLREIDGRIRYLQKRIDEINVVEQPPSDCNKIYFGAWVSLEDQQGQSRCYRIVGPDEIAGEKGWISIDAPLAQALLKKSVNDEVTVSLPNGEETFYVTAIRYQELI